MSTRLIGALRSTSQLSANCTTSLMVASTLNVRRWSVHVPQVRRGILWTVGEVRFCPVPLSRFPELERLRRAFLRWFKKFPLIYDHHPVGEHQLDYYLEGSAQNWGPIRGLPSGQIALENGQYFISRNASNVSLETLCRKLSLRGVICADKD